MTTTRYLLLHWVKKGVRDPFIIRSPEGDKFYLIATDLKINGGNGWDAAQNSGSQSLMIWESTDLVNWSDQRMVEVSAKIEAGCTWHRKQLTMQRQVSMLYIGIQNTKQRYKTASVLCKDKRFLYIYRSTGIYRL